MDKFKHLQTLGIIASALGQNRRAGVLFGALDRACPWRNNGIPPMLVADFKKAMQSARDGTGRSTVPGGLGGRPGHVAWIRCLPTRWRTRTNPLTRTACGAPRSARAPARRRGRRAHQRAALHPLEADPQAELLQLGELFQGVVARRSAGACGWAAGTARWSGYPPPTSAGRASPL